LLGCEATCSRAAVLFRSTKSCRFRQQTASPVANLLRHFRKALSSRLLSIMNVTCYMNDTDHPAQGSCMFRHHTSATSCGGCNPVACGRYPADLSSVLAVVSGDAAVVSAGPPADVVSDSVEFWSVGSMAAAEPGEVICSRWHQACALEFWIQLALATHQASQPSVCTIHFATAPLWKSYEMSDAP
jgi:hypothetical protein